MRAAKVVLHHYFSEVPSILGAQDHLPPKKLILEKKQNCYEYTDVKKIPWPRYTQQEPSCKKKWRFFHRRFWVKESRHSEKKKSDENCPYLYRITLFEKQKRTTSTAGSTNPSTKGYGKVASVCSEAPFLILRTLIPQSHSPAGAGRFRRNVSDQLRPLKRRTANG